MENKDMQDKKKEFYDRFTIEGDFPTRFELGGLKLANIVWGWLEYQLEEAEKYGYDNKDERKQMIDLKQAAKERGLTLGKIAKKMGLGRSTVYMWHYRKSLPKNYSHVKGLARILGLKARDLVDGV